MLFHTIPLVQPPPLHPFSLYLWKATHSFVTPYSWSLSQGLSNDIFLSLVPGLQAVASGMWTCPCPESLACRGESTCGDNPGCTWATWTTSDRTRPHWFHSQLGRNGPLHHKTKDNCQTQCSTREYIALKICRMPKMLTQRESNSHKFILSRVEHGKEKIQDDTKTLSERSK